MALIVDVETVLDGVVFDVCDESGDVDSHMQMVPVSADKTTGA